MYRAVAHAIDTDKGRRKGLGAIVRSLRESGRAQRASGCARQRAPPRVPPPSRSSAQSHQRKLQGLRRGSHRVCSGRRGGCQRGGRAAHLHREQSGEHGGAHARALLTSSAARTPAHARTRAHTHTRTLARHARHARHTHTPCVSTAARRSRLPEADVHAQGPLTSSANARTSANIFSPACEMVKRCLSQRWWGNRARRSKVATARCRGLPWRRRPGAWTTTRCVQVARTLISEATRTGAVLRKKKVMSFSSRFPPAAGVIRQRGTKEAQQSPL